MKYFILICLCMFAPVSLAQATDTQQQIPSIEEQAKEIGRELRCVVCQNQSIEDSDAPLAADMRKLVRQRLKQGASKTEVISYMRDRYGDYVLLKPPVKRSTYALWLLPFILLLGGLIWFFKGNAKTETTS